MADLYRDDADFGEPLEDRVLDPIWNWIGGALMTAIVVGFLAFEMGTHNVSVAHWFGPSNATTAQLAESSTVQK